jgi:hypothetical protein
VLSSSDVHIVAITADVVAAVSSPAVDAEKARQVAEAVAGKKRIGDFWQLFTDDPNPHKA